MQIKVFHIRLDKEHFIKDQEIINEFLENVNFKKSSVHLIESKVNFWSVLIHYEPKELTEENQESEIEEEPLSEEEEEIVKVLKDWRIDTSKEEMLPAYMILSNKTIHSLAKVKPNKIEDLDKVYGIGEKKKEQYGESLVALLNTII